MNACQVEAPRNNHIGRPPLYCNCMDLDASCELYFEECESLGKTPTITNLAVHLGMESRQSLFDYGKRPDFSCIVKKHKLRIEGKVEGQLMEGTGNPAGKIFYLKALHGYRDTFPEEQARPSVVTILLAGQELNPAIVGSSCHEIDGSCHVLGEKRPIGQLIASEKAEWEGKGS